MKLTTENTENTEGREMNERPTPETDAFAAHMSEEFIDPSWLEFSQELERERDEAREAVAKWESSFDAMERAGAEQARRADENREWALRAERERDEAREELSSIHRWVERHNQDGFDDKLTHRQNVDICYDLLYDRLDMAELELNRIKRAVIATLDENRHLADGMDCTLIKLRAVVPTWK